MTIAIVSDAIWPYNKGGKERRIFEVATRLSRRGHAVHIYTMQWWSGSSEKREYGLFLHGICPKLPLYRNKRRSIKQAIFFAFSCIRLLGVSFDVLEADSMPYIPLYILRLVTWIKRKQFIVVWHEVWTKSYWQSYIGALGTVAFWIEKVSCYLPDTVIAVSNTTQKAIEVIYKRTKSVHCIPNGISIDAIDAISPSKKPTDVLYAGRLLSHKHVDVLLYALSYLRDKKKPLTTTIIGEGPEMSHLKELVKKLRLGTYVRFFGRIEYHETVMSLLKHARTFVLPSTREGFGVSVLEAYACGVPVVTIQSPTNAAKELIKEGRTGYTCTLDAKNLAVALLASQKLAEKKTTQKACKAIAFFYNWDRLVGQIEKLYR